MARPSYLNNIPNGPCHSLSLFFSLPHRGNIPTGVPPRHDILYPRPPLPLTPVLPLRSQMKCIYGTCAGKTASMRRPFNFIFKMPAINLSNGLNRIGVACRAIRHELSLGGLWAYLSQPKTSAGRRGEAERGKKKKKSGERRTEGAG